MEKQISIIIPTYNMEAYIGKCLDSLIIPEFDAVEVLVVNDGSKDRSSEIAHSYADRYPASIRVIDKPNGNYGSCINAALPLATGRYVKILDADDTFDTQEFSKFVNKLPACEEDIILTNYVEVDLKGTITNICNREYGIKEDIAFPIYVLSDDFNRDYIQMHRVAYRTDIFKRFRYQQTERMSYTDTQWIITPIAYCETFRRLNISVYRYLIGREGQTMDPNQISRSLSQLFKLMATIVNTYETTDTSADAKNLCRSLIANRHQYIYNLALRNQTAESMALLKEYDTRLKEISPKLYSDIDSISYAPEIRFFIFKKLRTENYPLHLTIPLRHRIELSLKIRFRHLMNKRKSNIVRE